MLYFILYIHILGTVNAMAAMVAYHKQMAAPLWWTLLVSPIIWPLQLISLKDA